MTSDFKIKREPDPELLPHDFWDILCNRYFPVLSMTYITATLGIAFRQTDSFKTLLHYLFEDSYAYHMALWLALWVSIPAVFWIVIRNSQRFARMADIWYKTIAGVMVLVLGVSFALFPEADVDHGLRMFFVVTIPVFFIQYYCFIRGGLSPAAAWPLTLAGLVLMIYGILIPV
jgi:hypothetical protein